MYSIFYSSLCNPNALNVWLYLSRLIIRGKNIRSNGGRVTLGREIVFIILRLMEKKIDYHWTTYKLTFSLFYVMPFCPCFWNVYMYSSLYVLALPRLIYITVFAHNSLTNAVKSEYNLYYDIKRKVFNGKIQVVIDRVAIVSHVHCVVATELPKIKSTPLNSTEVSVLFFYFTTASFFFGYLSLFFACL